MTKRRSTQRLPRVCFAISALLCLATDIAQCDALSRTFEPRPIPNTKGWRDIYSLDTVDVNGDGDLDIIFTKDGEYDTLYIYENQGGGETWANHSFAVDGAAGHTAFADINRDGLVDIVCAKLAESKSNRFGWLKNNGNFTFEYISLVTEPHSDTYFKDSRPLAVDVDRDGHVDIIRYRSSESVNYWEGYEGTVFVHFGKSNATFESPKAATFQLNTRTVFMYAFDANDKKHPDLIIWEYGYMPLLVSKFNNDTRAFETPTPLGGSPTWHNARLRWVPSEDGPVGSVVTTGRTDGQSNAVRCAHLWSNKTPGGNWTIETIGAVFNNHGSGVPFCLPIDVDQDNDYDAIFQKRPYGSARILSISENIGNDSISSQNHIIDTARTFGPTNAFDTSVAVADIDRDGFPDFVFHDDELRWYRNGAFRKPAQSTKHVFLKNLVTHLRYIGTLLMIENFFIGTTEVSIRLLYYRRP